MAIKGVPIFMLVCMAMVIVQLGFGTYGVIVTKFAKQNNADPLIFCLVRDGLCFPILFLLSLFFEKSIIIPNKRELPVLISLGLFGMAFCQCFYILGVYFVSADIASMFQPIAPVWVSVLVVMLGLEPIPNIYTKYGFGKVSGVMFAVFGALLTGYGRYLKKQRMLLGVKVSQSFENMGYLSLVINTFSIAVYMVIQKKYIFTNKHSRFQHRPVGVTAWSYFFGFIFIAFASLYYFDQPEKFYSVNRHSIFPLIYAVFITSTLCYLLSSWSNMQIDSTIVTAFWPLQVLFCVIISYFVLGETLSPLEICGGLLMILSLFVVLWSNFHQSKLSKDNIKMTPVES